MLGDAGRESGTPLAAPHSTIPPPLVSALAGAAERTGTTAVRGPPNDEMAARRQLQSSSKAQLLHHWGRKVDQLTRNLGKVFRNELTEDAVVTALLAARGDGAVAAKALRRQWEREQPRGIGPAGARVGEGAIGVDEERKRFATMRKVAARLASRGREV